ncbi:excitatory amino acid transporter 1-like [Ylistrum balloti]|uniref:excitatory amino acid transporter 1-like n=1 Tax=Ylistrum balloti TaxID=509963 RepID=UPI002905BF1D|nr:excitatory amino acid transporter 1-like [Ylistrum balloti]
MEEPNATRDKTGWKSYGSSQTIGIPELEPEVDPTVSKNSKMEAVKRTIKNNLLLIFLIISMGIGIGLGAGLRYVDPPFTKRQIMYLRFPGDLLMNMLQMLILPLIVSSLVSGLASLDTRSSGRIGLRAVVYYLTTTLAAVVLGIILTVAIQPGTKGGDVEPSGESKIVEPADTFLDLLRQAFPSNLIEACFSKPVTEQVLKVEENINGSNVNATAVYDPVVEMKSGMNVLGIVVFSIFFGIIIGRLGSKGKPLVALFESLCEATMVLIKLVIWYSPLGIIFLVAAKIVEMEDPAKTFQQLLYYFITVMAGLIIHGFITLPVIYFTIVRKNPFRFIYGVTQAIVTAIGTSSSSATLPVTMKNLEENNGVDPRVIKFVAPVGATINMDGTALYEAVAVLFIGQIRGFEMDIGRIITVSITATAAAIGAAGVPQAGLVTMVIVLTAVGFPTDDVTLIIAIDWLLDRFRTAVNVMGDAIGAGIVDHLSKKEMRKMDLLDSVEDTENGVSNIAYEEADIKM